MMVRESVVDCVSMAEVYAMIDGVALPPPNLVGYSYARCVRAHEHKNGDRHQSLRVAASNGTWYCDVHRKGGGKLDLLVFAEKARDRAEAAKLLEAQFGDVSQRTNRAVRRQRARIVAEYEYCDEAGTVLYVVERSDPKRFRQKRPDGAGGWTYALNGVRRVPYRLQELRAGIERQDTVFVVEGEKDVDALIRLGLVATTNAQGTGFTWTNEWARFFEGATRIVVIPDCDAPGRKAAQQRADVLASICSDVRIVELDSTRSDGYDVSDWLKAHTTAELVAVTEQAHRYERTVRYDTIDEPSLVTVRADAVQAKRIEWLAKGRIPRGSLTAFDGQGGVGKTTLLLALIAAATRGRALFDGEEIPAIVALIVAEEDHLSVLKARLSVAGADLTRIHFVEAAQYGETRQSFMIPDNVGALERAIHETGASVVYIDALYSHLNFEGEGRMAQQVRRALRPLIEMAERTGCAVMVTRHWTKATGPASARALGSVEISNVARSVLSFGPHPNHEGVFVFATTKANLSALAPAIAYRLEVVDTTDDFGNPWQVTRAILEGEAEGVTADDLAMRGPGDPDERGAALEWLQDYLSDGEPHPSAQVYAAARKEGVGSRATIARAARSLHVEIVREGFATRGGSQTTWRLLLESRSSHSQSVRQADEIETNDEPETLILQRSSHDSALVSPDSDEWSDETSDEDVLV